MDITAQTLKTFHANETVVSIFLKNGIRLFGQIKRFDTSVILLRNESIIQMVYQHNIATVLEDAVSQQFKKAKI